MIPYSFNAFLAGAVSATVKSAVRFYAVSDDFAAAMITDGGELVDRAFEAVKRVSRSGSNDFERQIIIIPADVTLCHYQSPLAGLSELARTASVR